MPLLKFIERNSGWLIEAIISWYDINWFIHLRCACIQKHDAALFQWNCIPNLLSALLVCLLIYIRLDPDLNFTNCLSFWKFLLKMKSLPSSLARNAERKTKSKYKTKEKHNGIYSLIFHMSRYWGRMIMGPTAQPSTPTVHWPLGENIAACK